MDAEDLLYDLTEEMTNNFDSLIIFRDSVYDREFQGKTYLLPKIFRKKLNSSTNTQEKRILEALINYSHSLGEYYNYLDLYKEYRQLRFHEVTNELFKIQSKLDYILEELNNGKSLLDSEEDYATIEFFNRCISHVQKNLQNIINKQKYLIGDKLSHKLNDDRLKSDLKSEIINEFKKIVRNKIINSDQKSFLASETISILLQDSRVNGDLSSDIFNAETLDQRKKIIEKEISIRKSACKRDKKILDMFNKFRWLTYLCLFFGLIFGMYSLLLLFLIFGGINMLYSESLNPQWNAYKPGERYYTAPKKMGIFGAIYHFIIGFILSPIWWIYGFDHADKYRKGNICIKYKISALEEILNNKSY